MTSVRRGPPRRPRGPRKVTDVPLYCDFACPYASFAPAEASGGCRREQAVFCTLLSVYNNKNHRCLDRR